MKLSTAQWLITRLPSCRASAAIALMSMYKSNHFFVKVISYCYRCKSCAFYSIHPHVLTIVSFWPSNIYMAKKILYTCPCTHSSMWRWTATYMLTWARGVAHVWLISTSFPHLFLDWQEASKLLSSYDEQGKWTISTCPMWALLWLGHGEG